MSVQIKTTALALQPVSSASVPNNAIFLDQGDSTIASKDNSGGSGGLGGGGSENLLLKTMQNLSGHDIAGGVPVAKLANGSIAAADAHVAADQVVIGVSAGAILNTAQGTVALIGPNVAGALTGLGFAPGDPVYLAVGGGYTNNPSTITGSGNQVIRLGYADCPAGAASSTATDLIVFAETLVTYA